MIVQFAREYLRELTDVIDHIAFGDLERVIDTIYDAYLQRHNLFIMGNGGSASTASHFVCDMNKGVSNGRENRFRMFCLSDNIPTMLAYANDQSYDDIFIEQLMNLLGQDDIVIGISASGNSTNVIKAIQYTNDLSATSIGFTGFDGGHLGKIAKFSVNVPINDMQKIEDIHLILTHMIMQIIEMKLRQITNG